MSDLLRGRSALLLRILVSALLLGLVLVYVDAGEMARAVREGEWTWLAAGIAVLAVATVVGAARWAVLLDGSEIAVTKLRAGKIFAASVVLNHVLPSSIGGDALRAWLVGRESGLLVRAATATIVDKLTALVCLVVVGWAALVVDAESVPRSVIAVFAWLTLGLALAFAVAVLAAVGARPIRRRLPDRIATTIREVWATLRVWARSARLVTSLFGLGLAYQVLIVVSLLLIGRSVGLELSFALAAVSVAVVVVAMLVPVSVGGLGVREGGFVLLLGQADVGAAQATLFSLLGAVAMVVAAAAVVLVTAAAEAVRDRRTEPRTRQERPAAPRDA